MFHDGQLPPYAPDRVNPVQQGYIEQEFLTLLQSANPDTFSIRVRVRHNREYVDIPQGKMDVSGELKEARELIMIGSTLNEFSLSTPETTEEGISNYHVDEFRDRLHNLRRIFIVAHNKTNIFNLALVKDDYHIQIAFQRSVRRMKEWGNAGLLAREYEYKRGDFKDILITIPLSH